MTMHQPRPARAAKARLLRVKHKSKAVRRELALRQAQDDRKSKLSQNEFFSVQL